MDLPTPLTSESNLLSGTPTNPTNPEAFEAVQDLQYLNTITVTRALNAIGGKDTDKLRQELRLYRLTHMPPVSPNQNWRLPPATCWLSLETVKKTLEGKRDEAGTVTLRTKYNGDISELDYLISQYEILNRNY